MTGKGLVAGTIMVTNQEGESFFLVQDQREKVTFFFDERASENKSPMGTAMEILLKHVTVNPDNFRLMDLTNVKRDETSIPLFVFDLVERPVDPNNLLADKSKACWRRAKDLDHLFGECDFEGVPVYQG